MFTSFFAMIYLLLFSFSVKNDKAYGQKAEDFCEKVET